MIQIAAAALAAVVAGCAIVPVIVPPATGAAACVVIQKHPEAAGYIKAAGGVFAAFGRTNTPPTSADLAAALANLPGGNFNVVYAQAIWAGAVEAYALIWKAAQTPAQQASLSATLTGIGASLQLAADSCGPAPSPAVTAAAANRLLASPVGTPLLAHPEDADAVAKAVAKDLKNWKAPRK